MICVEEYELEIEYREKKSEELKNKVIYVDLEKYRESYADEVFHLQQQYDKSLIENYIQPLKKEFLVTLISKNLNDTEKLYSPSIDSIIDDIDTYITDIDMDISEDDEY